VIVDSEAENLVNFVCGANQDDHHYINANWGRDASFSEIAPIRKIVAGDESPDGRGKLSSARGIEVGHVFQLGTKYSEAMNATVLDENGKKITVIMGCYGIGVSRIVAAAIEQNHDERGIIWQNSMAPFKFAIIPIAMQKSEQVKHAANNLYQELTALNYEVLFDDRSESPGVKFADMDLIGIPHQLILSEKKLTLGMIEYKNRQTQQSEDIKIEHLIDFLKMINV
jgi:prolyl-tRNA synthetase